MDSLITMIIPLSPEVQGNSTWVAELLQFSCRILRRISTYPLQCVHNGQYFVPKRVLWGRILGIVTRESSASPQMPLECVLTGFYFWATWVRGYENIGKTGILGRSRERWGVNLGDFLEDTRYTSLRSPRKNQKGGRGSSRVPALGVHMAWHDYCRRPSPPPTPSIPYWHTRTVAFWDIVIHRV